MTAVVEEEIDQAAVETFVSETPSTPSTELAVREMKYDDWRMIKEQSTALEEAGKGTAILPKGITNRWQIAAILQKGWEMGLPPMYSLSQISLVNGKPVVQSQALTAIIQRAHGRDAVRVIESDDKHALVEFRARDSKTVYRSEFTMADAQKAGLASKDVWKQYPRVMLRWRAIGEGARVYFADILAGVYLPDEMDMPMRVEGEELVIDATRAVDTTTGEIRDLRGDAAPDDGDARTALSKQLGLLRTVMRPQAKTIKDVYYQARRALGWPEKGNWNELTADELTALTGWTMTQIDLWKTNTTEEADDVVETTRDDGVEI